MGLNSYCKTPAPVTSGDAPVRLPLLAQSSGHLKVGEVPKVAGKRGAAVQAKIPLTVDPGFHVNSNTPNERVPDSVEADLEGHRRPRRRPGRSIPKPAQEKYEFSEKPLSVFTGNFDVTANFKVAANAPAGPGVAAGQLRYQACNDKACFPPKTVEINLPYSVQ